MKKGVQYSHYCGTELLELISGINLVIDLMKEDPDAAKEWGDYSLKMVGKLRDKIAALDKLNKMEY